MDMRFSLGTLQIALVAITGLAGGSALKADMLLTCAGCSSSTVGGTAMVASSSVAPPDLTIVRNLNDNSGLPQGPNPTPVVLIPNNTVGGATLQFTTKIVSGTFTVGASTYPCDLPCTLGSLGLVAQWSTAGSNFPTDYLGNTRPSGPSVLFARVPVQFAQGMDPEVKYSGIASFSTGTIFTAFLSDPIVNSNLKYTGVPARDATGVAGSLIVGAPASVPEPSSCLLLGAALLGCVPIARRRRAGKGVSMRSAVSFSVACLICLGSELPARADTFVIDDQANVLTINQLGASDSLISGGDTCQGLTEISGIGCRFLVSRNDGATVALSTGDQILNLAEANRIFVSDAIETHPSLGGTNYAEVTFYSQPDGSLGFRCDAFGGCQGVETAGDHVVGTVFWTDGGSDTVLVRSGPEAPAAVPEPAAGLLFGTGCVGLLGYGWRRRRRPVQRCR
jgi:hypothetical protein